MYFIVRVRRIMFVLKGGMDLEAVGRNLTPIIRVTPNQDVFTHSLNCAKCLKSFFI
jgi:hypothetical protein